MSEQSKKYLSDNNAGDLIVSFDSDNGKIKNELRVSDLLDQYSESQHQQIKELEGKLSKISNLEKRVDQDLCMRLVLDHFFPPPNYDPRSYDEMIYQLQSYQQKYPTK